MHVSSNVPSHTFGYYNVEHNKPAIDWVGMVCHLLQEAVVPRQDLRFMRDCGLQWPKLVSTLENAVW